MRQRTIRRAVAAASATAMAGATLVVGGAGVASAQEVTKDGRTSSNAGAYMSYKRTVSNVTPTYGDVVTISAEIQRHGWLNTATLSSMRNLHPDCFEYVDGSANWIASGKSYSQATHPNEVKPGTDYLELDPPGLWETTPFTMSAEFRVLCEAGEYARGGLTWNTPLAGQGSDSGSEKVGPSVTVKRKGTTVFLGLPTSPQVGQPVTFYATTTNVPDGGQVAFSVDGAIVGSETVLDDKVSFTWTPTTPGSKVVQASFDQTGTHGGSVSQERSFVVSPTNENSSVTLSVAGSPKVGQETTLTAAVSPAGEGGTVVFKEEGAIIGTAPVGADAKARIPWVPAASGQRTIDAEFSGRTGVNPSVGAISIGVAAADPDDVVTTTSLDVASVTSVGEEVTIKATVTPGVTSGTVTFSDGGTEIGTVNVQADGTATLTWVPTTDGERTIRAVYAANGKYLTSQGTAQLVVTPAIVDPDPDPDPDPTDPATGSLGSLTGSGDAGNASGSLGSLSNFGS